MLNRILDTMWGQATNLLTAPIKRRRWVDLLVILALGGLVVGLMLVGREWTVLQRPVVQIDLSLWALPKYALMSLSRALVAFSVSLCFTFVFAYWAAKDPVAERVLIPILDILQSVPLLGFLPMVLLAMVSLFPRSNVGIELSAVIIIVTCQAWNMAFSLYQSLKTLPAELDEVSRSYGLRWLQRFRWVELPFATPGLVWNSMVSVANGWFFLMASEAFRQGSQDFRLPGVGAYMAVAVDQGDGRAQIYAILTMLAIVILLDQLVWKPVMAWSQRFQLDEAVKVEKHRSWLLRLLRRSELVARLRRALERRRRARVQVRRPTLELQPAHQAAYKRGLGLGMLVMLLLVLALGAFKLWSILGLVTGKEWWLLVRAGAASMARVLASTLIATLWTLPVGLWIGMSPVWSRRLQPVVQVVASFPMSILFMALVVWLQHHRISLFTSSILLMSLSTQWYLLFNIIAGAQAIPSDLREMGRAFRLTRWKRFTTLYFPAIFPFLVTGWVTATGGAWNASIITEFVSGDGRTFSTFGLGSELQLATAAGSIPLITASSLLMAGIVVLFNRLVWLPLYRMAETRYTLDR